MSFQEDSSRSLSHNQSQLGPDSLVCVAVSVVECSELG